MEGTNLFPRVPHVAIGENSKILTPFGPMIYQTFLSDENIKALLDEGDKLTKEHDDWNYQLAGNLVRGRSFTYSVEFRDSYAPVILNEVDKFRYSANQVFGDAFPEEDMQLKSLWVNYQKQYDFNPNHIHSDYLSFVIYCDVPDRIFDQQAECNLPMAGSISFMYGEPTILNNQTFNVRPTNNLMFIFPATLQHMVYPFYSDDTRISVSGNIAIVNNH